MTHNTTISTAAQEVLAARLKTITGKVQHLCEATGLPQEVGSKLLSDISDLQQDIFNGLRLSYDEIEAIQEHTTPADWDSIHTEETHYILQEYGQLWQLEQAQRNGSLKDSIIYTDSTGIMLNTYKMPYIKATDGSTMQIKAVALYDFLRRNNLDEQENEDGAVIYRHIFATMSLYDLFGIDEADIIRITPAGLCRPELAAALQGMNAANLIELKEQRAGRRNLKREAKPADGKAKDTEDTDTGRSSATIAIMQNTADMLSRSINTADMDENGQAVALRSLKQAVKEKARNEAIGGGSTGAAVAPYTYIMQAFNGLCVITNTMKPISDGAEYAAYELTLNELTQKCTGVKDPNALQISNIWRAFNFISTQRLEFIEYRTPERKRTYNRKNTTTPDNTITREENGRKVIYKPYRITTNPAIATFKQELTNPEAYSGSTSVVLNIHHIIKNGRRTEEIRLPDGSKALIKQPVKHLTTLDQIYTFTSPAGIHFLNLLLSKSHIAEEDALNSVFEYESSIAACSTDEEARRRRRNITNHKGRDRDTLQGFFAAAKECNLLAWYRRYDSTDKAGKSVAVWSWGRPTTEEVKKLKQY